MKILLIEDDEAIARMIAEGLEEDRFTVDIASDGVEGFEAARTRPYAIVLIFVAATIITPTPDVLTLIAMSLPMCLLYESCIWIAWFMQRKALKAAGG